MRYFILGILFLIFIYQPVFGQNYPQDYFINPMKINSLLSGTFAELRNNHFHSGIDIKTGGVIGKEVFATADGYVSRIKIAPNGYGKAIYITHSNGYTTVYAHMEYFEKEIEKIIKAEQYSRKNFAIDYYPSKEKIIVKRGQLIGYSGNTGSSGGPHLHYEIRDSRERPLNPLEFGLVVEDKISPVINKIRFYCIKNENSIPKIIDYQSKNYDTLTLSSNFYMGINSFDKQNNTDNRNGIYSMIIKLDSTIIYHFLATRIDFSEQRYINAFIDYSSKYKQGTTYQITKKLPGNKLSVYEKLLNNGIFTITDEKPHLITIIVSDFAGNNTETSLWVKSGMDESKIEEKPFPNVFFDKKNEFNFDEVKITIPAGVLYENTFIDIKILEESTFSSIINYGNPETPMHSYSTISIKLNKDLPKRLESKLCIASKATKNGQKYYEGGNFHDNYITTKTRSFGLYFIDIDTIAPSIEAINFVDKQSISNLSKLTLKITDDFSGIKTAKAFVNNQWVLGEMDSKTNQWIFEKDENWPKGQISFKIILTDDRNNESIRIFELEN